MVDLFGRPIDEEAPRVLGPVPEDMWVCHSCADRYENSVPVTIVVVGELHALAFCSDVCALAEGYNAAVRTRRLCEQDGLGWQIVVTPDGRPLSEAELERETSLEPAQP